jgi:two-component system response regulator (stage 0 sporulation protein F)
MKGLKVLLVEDDENLSFILEERLKSEGYETKIAKDAAEGYSIYLKFRPDLVISDLQLPGDNGVELVSRIRKISNLNVRTIYMSADLEGLDSEIKQEKDRPEVNVLAKPFSTDKLMEILSAH